MFDKKSAQDLHRMHRILPVLEAVLSFANPLLLAQLLAQLLLAQLLAQLPACTTTSRTTSAHFEFLKGVCIK